MRGAGRRHHGSTLYERTSEILFFLFNAVPTLFPFVTSLRGSIAQKCIRGRKPSPLFLLVHARNKIVPCSRTGLVACGWRARASLPLNSVCTIKRRIRDHWACRWTMSIKRVAKKSSLHLLVSCVSTKAGRRERKHCGKDDNMRREISASVSVTNIWLLTCARAFSIPASAFPLARVGSWPGTGADGFSEALYAR